jgi:hypothetical protein
LIKNNKYFVPPVKDNRDFKELFNYLSSVGAGRPVEKDGVPGGPWTPELLAKEISEISTDPDGIDLRTVQHWFQDNEKGISSDNIRWLARIFGCHDPEATGVWQAELIAANRRLVAKRRGQRRRVSAAQAVVLPKINNDEREHLSLAEKSEAMFDGRNPLNLPIVVWGSCSVLWFLAYFSGVHSITYSPLEGVSKQVGFFWSPAWNVGELIFLPIFLVITAQLLSFWKDERHGLFASGVARKRDDDGWMNKVRSFSVSFWAIMFICFGVIFLLQWSGVYLLALIEKKSDISMVDWLLVAIERPDVISIPASLTISFIAFMYSGVIYMLFFAGLLLLYAIVNDFSEMCGSRRFLSGDGQQHQICEVGSTIMHGVFRCAVLGSLIAVSIKLNAAYLISDGETIFDWLINDASYALGLSDENWGWINGSPSPFITSLFLLLIVYFVFFSCMAQIFVSLERSVEARSWNGRLRVKWLKMMGVMILLCASFLLIGRFTGFSLLLAASVLIALGSLLWRAPVPVRQSKLEEGKTI